MSGRMHISHRSSNNQETMRKQQQQQQLQYLTIGEIPELVLAFDTAGGHGGVGDGLQGLHSIKTLSIGVAPKFLSSDSSSLHRSPFPSSLQVLHLSHISGMKTLSPLSNLTSLGRLAIWDYEDLRVDATSLTELAIGWDDEVERFTKEQNVALLLLSSLKDLHFGSLYCVSRQNRGTALPRIPHGNRKNRDKFESKKFEFKLVRFSWLTARASTLYVHELYVGYGKIQGIGLSQFEANAVHARECTILIRMEDVDCCGK
uniref:Uncharacterized protein n=1 Tax=Oryza brachyantha TaxID=4533 RepID=J3MHH1_ORYBR